MSKAIFITTTLPYVNSSPHMGHAFEFILADAIARRARDLGNRVRLNVGLDEHGAKVWRRSESLGLPISEYLDGRAAEWLGFCEAFHISHDSFYRTSSPGHAAFVRGVWSRFVDDGLIYEKMYEGKYCEGCESFKTDRDLVDGACPDHPGTPVQLVNERNYFFRLSRFGDSISGWLASGSFLVPSHKTQELSNMVYACGDISVSRPRTSCPWGVSVPGDDDQVVYVWFDALLNYVAAGELLAGGRAWDTVLQLCGPDNLRFQGLVYQSFLDALGIPKTDTLLVHGTILDEFGMKMSKSVGNVVDPVDQLSKYGVDAVRYYALAGIRTTQDSVWSEPDLVSMWNSDVCNDFGNLMARVLHLMDTYAVHPHEDAAPHDLDCVVSALLEDAAGLWSEYRIKDALAQVRAASKACNKFLTDEQPWAKDADPARRANALLALHRALLGIARMYRPVLVAHSADIEDALAKRPKKTVIFRKIENQ